MIELPEEFLEVKKVLEQGAKKYGQNDWLKVDCPSMTRKLNSASMFRHLAEYYHGVEKDPETELNPLLHLACRALMAYTRQKRGIDT